MDKLLIIFIILNALNVIIQTIKSLCTIKCGKGVAALVNAFAYAFYTVVLIYTINDLPTWQKALVVGLCNLVGVFLVKWAEEKSRKDRLWKIELTVLGENTIALHNKLEEEGIPNSYISQIGKYSIFNIYCATQKESAFTKKIADTYYAKYFVTESKIL